MSDFGSCSGVFIFKERTTTSLFASSSAIVISYFAEEC